MNKNKGKYIMTVTGKGYDTEAIVYLDRETSNNDFVNTREHFETIKARLETDINQYHIYKLVPQKEKDEADV